MPPIPDSSYYQACPARWAFAALLILAANTLLHGNAAAADPALVAKPTPAQS